jgi:hypothetical protein
VESTSVKQSELKPFDKKLVVVTLQDGSRRTGRLYEVLAKDGLYNVEPDPERSGQTINPEDIYADDIVSVEPLGSSVPPEG